MLLELVRALDRRAALDLAQGRDHGVGVLGQVDRAGVGDVLPRPRQHHADDDGQPIADRGEGQADQDQRHGVLVVAPPAPAGIDQAPEDQFGDDADDAGEDRGDDHGPHVLVDDVGQLVGQHGLQLVAVRVFTRPRVTVTLYWPSCRPVAKAFRLSLSR
jgi:hypothetical protein